MVRVHPPSAQLLTALAASGHRTFLRLSISTGGDQYLVARRDVMDYAFTSDDRRALAAPAVVAEAAAMGAATVKPSVAGSTSWAAGRPARPGPTSAAPVIRSRKA